MIRQVIAIIVIVFACLLAWLWFFAPPQRLAASFAHEDCRRVGLTDRETGRSITGIEDLAIIPGSDRVLLSAHDRGAPDLPDGGLYETSLFLLTSGTDLALANLVDVAGREQPFRPHGIAISPDGARLAVINRVATGQAQIEIGPLGREGWHLDTRIRGASLCRANDLDFIEAGQDAVSITIDRAECGPSLADMMPGANTGRILSYAAGALEEDQAGLVFPNGISGDWIAETRRNRVISRGGREIVLPGGPDNLNPADKGGLIAALHPKLARLWLYLEGWSGHAPSRLVQVDPAQSAVTVLFDDPRGEVFSAATSALVIEDHLIAGSVRDAGLLICEPAQ